MNNYEKIISKKNPNLTVRGIASRLSQMYYGNNCDLCIVEGCNESKSCIDNFADHLIQEVK